MRFSSRKKIISGQSYKSKALDLFKKRLGKIVNSSELASITGRDGKPISHNIRRIFELRDEEGYKIVNHTDNSSTGLKLKVDEWMLISPDPDPSLIKARGVNKRVRYDVFERDNYACKICGRNPDDDDPQYPGKKIRLHVGHKIAHKRNSSDYSEKSNSLLTVDDFITMCSVCNEGAKNKDVKLLTLLDRVKNTSTKEKNEIRDYLSQELRKGAS